MCLSCVWNRNWICAGNKHSQTSQPPVITHMSLCIHNIQPCYQTKCCLYNIWELGELADKYDSVSLFSSVSVWHVYRVQTWFKLLEYGTEWASALTSVRTQFICQVQSSEEDETAVQIKHWLCLSHDSRNLLNKSCGPMTSMCGYMWDLSTSFNADVTDTMSRSCFAIVLWFVLHVNPLECAGWLHYSNFQQLFKWKY